MTEITIPAALWDAITDALQVAARDDRRAGRLARQAMREARRLVACEGVDGRRVLVKASEAPSF